MIPGSANPLLLATAAVGGYQVSRSLRFNSADSAYLSRTPASAGNRKTFTWAAWVKRAKLGTYQRIFNARNPGVAADYIRFNNNDTLEIYIGASAITSQVFRDVSAWFHLAVAVDTTQSTSSNRVKLYVNGTQVTTFGTANYPSQNADSVFNAALIHSIGTGDGTTEYVDAYLADVHLVDGQQLDPTSFGEFDATTGVWNPKAYTGTYGTNGFRLPFSDNSAATSTTLGKDAAGSNNWTPNNLSVTAGAGNDSLVDVPTNYGTDSGIGGNVRGNYCTLNPLSTSSGTYSQGNLRFEGASSWMNSNGTFAVSTGKWYYEVTVANAPYSPRSSSSEYNGFGWAVSNVQAATTTPRTQSDAVMYGDNGYYKNFTGSNTDGGAVSSGDVLAIAVDLDANTFYLYKNNSQIATGTIGGTAGRELTPRISSYNGSYGALDVNFGQRPFAYTAPSGFKALCTANLPAPTIVKPNTVFDAKTYQGNGGAQTVTLPGAFSPDFVWIKNRSRASFNVLFDIVRGPSTGTSSSTNKALASDATDAEGLGSTIAGLTSFNSDGFTLASDQISPYNATGPSSESYIAWCWDGGSSTVTNTSGSITSTVSVRANTTAGFSVVTWTGQSTACTIGHGLGVAPSLIICKARSNAQSWGVYHKDVGINNYLLLDSTGASTSYAGIWGSSAPTSTVFSVPGNVGLNNNNGWTYVAYCFAPVAGYSSMGSFTASNGAFVYTGFRPRFLLLKCSDTAGRSWVLLDTARGQYNVNDKELYANLADAEYTTSNYDLVSNGFVVRSTSAAYNTGTWIYYAVAESPFQYARAR